MDSGDTEYTALAECPAGEAAPAISDTGITIKRRPAEAAYSVCKDSVRNAVVTIGALGEHQIHLNGELFFTHNGPLQAFIRGPFQRLNDIKVSRDGKPVFVAHFLKP